MQVGARRFSAVTVLVGIVMLLVPALAWMQYQWLGQLSQAERERMQRTLRTAASQFAVEFDSELSKALIGLQVEGPVLRDENWNTYAQRYSAWTESAGDSKLVRDVLLVDAIPGTKLPSVPPPPPPAPSGQRSNTAIFETHVPSPILGGIKPDQLRVRRWNPSTLAFEPTEWTPDLLPFRDSLATHFVGFQIERSPRGTERFRREGSLAFNTGDDNTLVSPVTLFETPPDRQGPPKITILGFTLVRLDPTVVHDTLLASLTARHGHGDDTEMDYRVAVVNREDPSRVVWESEPGAAKTIGDAPDVTQDFMAPRPDQMFIIARSPGTGSREPATGIREQAGPTPTENIVVSVLERRDQVAAGGRSGNRGRPAGAFEGRWTLLAKHRSGSLEAAVAAVRMRNLLLSSGILLLLSISVGLIVVSSRRAQELARQQMEFVAAVSHELRTPVSVIGTAASNLADGVVGDPQRVRKYGETIQTEARRLAETVERVLQLAGIAAGRAAAAQTMVCPADLVADSIHACKTEIDGAGFTVETDVAMDIPMVAGDVTALRSALQNLISNAVKYGGDARWIKVSAVPGAGSREPGTVIFRVEDRGLGIDAEDRKHIFEPFYRGREAVSKQIHGSGLGLNLVHRIAEAHGGRVSVSSEPGKGSVFSLTLPAVNEVAQASAAHAATEAVARS
jgi:two-component system, OmpR family, sensor histidine kinase SenX3